MAWNKKKATGLNFARIRVNTTAAEFARIHVDRRSRVQTLTRVRTNFCRDEFCSWIAELGHFTLLFADDGKEMY